MAGSENSAREARSEYRALIANPEGQLRAKIASREARSRNSQLTLPGNQLLQDSIEWGKQNLADLTQVATDLDIRWTDQGKEWTSQGSVPRIRWVGAGFPDYPWLFGVDGEYTAHASVTLGQFEPIKDHMRALRDISEVLSEDSGVVVHEVVADGSVWYGKDGRGTNPDTGAPTYDFNTDEIVKFPAAVALIWRWTGDDGFRDEMLDFTRRNLEYVRTRLDDDGDGWPQGNGNVERARHGRGEARQRRLLHPRAVRLRRHGAGGRAGRRRPTRPRPRGDGARRALRGRVVDRGGAAVRGLARRAGNEKINQQHWIGVDPMEAELYVDGEFVPGLAAYANGSRALATRENGCYSGTRPGNRGLFHTGCEGGPNGEGEPNIFSLNTGIQAVGEGNYGRLGAEQQRRYTDANAETQFSQPATGGHAGRAAGRDARDHAVEHGRRQRRHAAEHRPLLDVPVDVHAGVGPLRHRVGGRAPAARRAAQPRARAGSRSCRRCPTGSRASRATDIRLGSGSADVLASRAGKRHTTKTDTADAPVRTFRIGHTLPRGSDGGVGHARRPRRDPLHGRGRPTAASRSGSTADPQRLHTLVVTAA